MKVPEVSSRQGGGDQEDRPVLDHRPPSNIIVLELNIVPSLDEDGTEFDSQRKIIIGLGR